MARAVLTSAWSQRHGFRETLEEFQPLRCHTQVRTALGRATGAPLGLPLLTRLLRALRGLAAVRLLERAPQPLHEIDHLRLPRLLAGRELDRLPLHLALDDAQQVFAVLVGVLGGVPLRGKIADERLVHFEFFAPDA